MPEYDEYGMLIPESLEKKDDWPSRSGIALALKSCANIMTTEESVSFFFKFLMEKEALGC